MFLKETLMKMYNSFCASLAVAAAFTSTPALAQHSWNDPRNAATWYDRAIEQIERLPEHHLFAILSHDWDKGPPPEQVRDAVAAAQPVISFMQRGAQQEFSDRAIDRSFGIELALPHLNQLRRAALIANADAMIRLHDGDSAGAAQRLAHVYRLSMHIGDDAVAISSLVGQSIFQIADRTVQTGLDQGAFGQTEAAELLRETQRLASTGDPFNFVGAAIGEHEILLHWFDEAVGDPDAAEHYLSMMGMAATENDVAFARELSVMSREEFGEALLQFDDAADHMIEIMSMKDAAAASEAMAELMEQFTDGEFGPLARLLASWDRVLKQKQRGDVLLQKRIDSLREIVQGEVDPDAIENAAVWYLRAVRMLEAVDDDSMALLRRFVLADEENADPDDHPVSRQLEPMLILAGSIIDELREGSLKRRCNFAIAGSPSGSLTTSYAAGMRDAFRLAHSDALRLLRAGDPEGFADRLAIGYRMIAHLSADPQMVSSITAHRALLEAHEILASALDSEAITEEHLAVLRSAFDAIDAADAFGYLASRRALLVAVVGLAEHADARLGDFSRAVPLDEEDEDAAAFEQWLDEVTGAIISNVQIVREADDQGLLTYAALWHFSQGDIALDEAICDVAKEEFRAVWSPLADVFDVDALFRASRDALAWYSRFLEQRRFVFHGLKPQKISVLADRRPLARADIRATGALLRKPQGETPAEQHGE